MNEEEKKRLSESEVDDANGAETSSEVTNESESQAETDNTQPTMSEPEPEAVETAVSEDENGDESEPEPEAEQQQPQEEQPQPQPQQQQPMEKMLTQSQVNELVGRARQEGRESALKELYGRYGVSGDSELNDVFGRGQAYLTLDDDFKAEQSSNKALLAENALLKTKVDESRWEDIKAILGSKNMDITPENIEAEIPTHPEWRQTVSVQQQQQQQAQAQPQQDSLQPQPQPQQAVLRKLGSESTAKDGGNGDDEESEQERAMKLFGFNK